MLQWLERLACVCTFCSCSAAIRCTHEIFLYYIANFCVVFVLVFGQICVRVCLSCVCVCVFFYVHISIDIFSCLALLYFLKILVHVRTMCTVHFDLLWLYVRHNAMHTYFEYTRKKKITNNNVRCDILFQLVAYRFFFVVGLLLQRVALSTLLSARISCTLFNQAPNAYYKYLPIFSHA